MGTVNTVLFTVSLLLLLGAFYYYLVYQKSGAYPPKYIILERIRFLGGSGGVLFLLSCVIYFLI